MLRSGIQTWVILSIFDDALGPIPYVYTPGDIEKIAVGKVADITIDQYLNDRTFPKQLLLIPFPMINKVGRLS